MRSTVTTMGRGFDATQQLGTWWYQGPAVCRNTCCVTRHMWCPQGQCGRSEAPVGCLGARALRLLGLVSDNSTLFGIEDPPLDAFQITAVDVDSDGGCLLHVVRVPDVPLDTKTSMCCGH